ncbi:hypothetical protein [Herbiconiux ginsengi]|uniref:Uncharacterized protein n=1 Tax=Herbiconiux ginsengi TaxID=381665 RepID=A0A1H3KCI9_9MICO|nr:hypothetical protein [Herbiconiux ginsengi]SDY49900.1 hypothetical protein SAMN05216554_0507 [Herbiconiux ginsengi]
MSASGSGESPAEKKSFNERLRDRYFGRRRAGSGDPDAPVDFDGPAESVLPKSNQMGFFGRVQRPGGFDTPPEEPVELEGPLPWELGGDAPDDSEGERSAR